MNFGRKLPDADQVRREQALTAEEVSNRIEYIDEVHAILKGTDKRKLIIVGPCSADRVDSVLEFTVRLAKLREEVSDKLLIIPRVYTSKPRTNGGGYKGMVHRPKSTSEKDDICSGIQSSRHMHLRVIQETGMYAADEMLYPELHYYLSDLLAYTAVGARSVENQQHRLVSSGLDMPVGMKNPTSGDTQVMLNAVSASQMSQTLFYHGYECTSNGNPYAHSILRGYTDSVGRTHSNYHYENIVELHDSYQKMNLKTPAVVIDCNHANSRKHYDEQIRISKEVFGLCREYDFVNRFVKGCMIESYLKDGAKKIGANAYGQSITDPCLGWEKTERLVRDLATIL